MCVTEVGSVALNLAVQLPATKCSSTSVATPLPGTSCTLECSEASIIHLELNIRLEIERVWIALQQVKPIWKRSRVTVETRDYAPHELFYHK